MIIVGDVSGKGLKAAMTVSLIVGTLRTLADYTQSPAGILRGLNRRLIGRIDGGFVTCLVLHLSANGETDQLRMRDILRRIATAKSWRWRARCPWGFRATRPMTK